MRSTSKLKFDGPIGIDRPTRSLDRTHKQMNNTSFNARRVWVAMRAPRPLATEPTIIFQAAEDFLPSIPTWITDTILPASYLSFYLGTGSRRILAVQTPAPKEQVYRCILQRIHVITIPSNTQKRASRMYYLAPLCRLIFDPGRWCWWGGDQFYTYTAKKG